MDVWADVWTHDLKIHDASSLLALGLTAALTTSSPAWSESGQESGPPKSRCFKDLSTSSHFVAPVVSETTDVLERTFPSRRRRHRHPVASICWWGPVNEALEATDNWRNLEFHLSPQQRVCVHLGPVSELQDLSSAASRFELNGRRSLNVCSILQFRVPLLQFPSTTQAKGTLGLSGHVPSHSSRVCRRYDQALCVW